MRILKKIGSIYLFTVPLFAATLNVPANYTSIQSAIIAASNGDTVMVAPGKYSENINFLGKAITVRSSNGPAVTIIDGRDADSVVRFGTKETASSVLQGFTIQNGVASPNNSYLGGGVSISNSSPTITGNIITLNRGSTGAGIAISFGSPIIEGNTITKNSGEGIFVVGNSPNTGTQIIGNVISNNTSGYTGAGIDLFSSGPVLIQNNLMTGNNGSSGGAIGMVNGSNPKIIQNLIVGNSGGTGGGFYSLAPFQSTAYLLNNTIVGNNSFKGSAVYIDGPGDGGVQMVNNILLASPGQGAVYCGNFNNTSTPVMSFNDVVGAPGRNYEGLCSEQTGQNENISADPLFDCSAGNNYRLSLASPAIDVGNTTAASLPANDYDGNPRLIAANNLIAKVDLGAYEFQGRTALSASTTSLAFGQELVGFGAPVQAISLQNTGSQTAWFCGFHLSSDFAESDTCSDHLNPGASCSINLTFKPTSEGPKSIVLSIDANTTFPLQIDLTGTGIELRRPPSRSLSIPRRQSLPEPRQAGP